MKVVRNPVSLRELVPAHLYAHT